jgi:hypothetical protein
MINDVAMIRSLIVYAICLPLAILVGCLIAGPLDYWTLFWLGVVLFLLVLPLLFRWHHVWLIVIWNSATLFYFLPGQPPGWLLLAFLGFFVSLGHYILNRERRFLHAPGVTWSLLFLGLVVLVTAKLTGGLGLRVFGDAVNGGKRYVYIWLAILGYFAFTCQPIPKAKRNLYATLFIASGVTAVIGELAAVVGPAFYFIFLLFPADVSSAALTKYSPVTGDAIIRWGGISAGSTAVLFAMMARYGIAGILDIRKLWRPIAFALLIGLSMLGGFRSMMILIGMTFVIVFYLEGLLRSRLMPVMLLATLLAGTLAISFVDKLPVNVQRSVAFVPLLPISPIAKSSADASSDWRIDMWKNVIPQIPHYLILGKGYSFSADDAAMIRNLGNVAGEETGYGSSFVGDYHNGPLSVIMPFGIFGSIAFLWFLGASFQVLRANYKYGDPDCRRVNTFLLSYFVAKVILFFVVFGGLYTDLAMFVGIVGFSITYNGGVAKRVPVAQPQIAFRRFPLLPAQRPVEAR